MQHGVSEGLRGIILGAGGWVHNAQLKNGKVGVGWLLSRVCLLNGGSRYCAMLCGWGFRGDDTECG